MNIKYKHGITDQGKEMLVTEDLEGGSSPSVSAWALRRRGLYALALFSICITIMIWAVIGTGNRDKYNSQYLFEHFQPLVCSRRKSA